MLRDSGMEESRHPKIAELRKFMLNRPSKAIMAPFAEGLGALAAPLTQPFVSRDVGYLQVESGQKSRKVRNLMLQSPFKSMLARTAIFALLLALAISFVTVGLAPSATAQSADDDPCEANSDGTAVTCTYDENDDAPVANFSGMDPEGEMIAWSLAGDDATSFDITGGVLTFKKAPNYENTRGTGGAADNTYDVTVVATEVRAPGSLDQAESTEIMVTVTVMNVDEDPTLTLNRLQVRGGADATTGGTALTAELTDPDVTDDAGAAFTVTVTYAWFVPKVSRPVLDNDDHWTAAGNSANSAAAYQPVSTDANKFLRVVATYSDALGTGKKEYARSAYAVVAALPAGTTNNAPEFPSSVPDPVVFTVRENSAKGTVVGSVRASDNDSGDILSHELAGTNAGLFDIDIATGRITVDGDIDHETNATLTFTVNALDPSGGETGARTVNITVDDVNDPPVGATEAAANRTVPENHDLETDATADPATTATVLGTYEVTADTDPDDTDGISAITLSLGGVDGSLFSLTDTAAKGGTLDNNIYELGFKESPNYESPADADGNNKYHVTVITTDNEGASHERALVIEVTNVDEPGKVTMSTAQPAVGQPITATLTDPDMKVTGVSWQWGRSDTASNFIPIRGATSATYTPVMSVDDDPITSESELVEGDEGMYLEVTVIYSDNASARDAVNGTPDDTSDDPTDVTTTDNDESKGERLIAQPSANAVREAPDVNQMPVFESGITREVREDAKAGDKVGGPVTANDPDEGDVLTYSISGGADMGAFEITSGGQITVKEGTKLDFEGSQTTYVIEVTADDPFGMSDSTTVTITVTDANEPPEVTAPGDPCEQDASTKAVTCDYDENGMDPVGTFNGMDPEGEMIAWSLAGDDAASFDITGGVLTFKKAPNYENTRGAGGTTADNTYDVTVVATEVRAPGSLDQAESTEIMVTVTVMNVDEDPTLTLNRLQVRGGADATTGGTALTAELTDPDVTDDAGAAFTVTVTYAWFVPKVNRPVLDNDDHWTAAGNSANSAAAYQPVSTDANKFLRVVATYSDALGTGKKEYARSTYAVVAALPADTTNNAPEFPSSVPDPVVFTVRENSAKGTVVGSVRASDNDSGDILSHELAGTNAGLFDIDIATGRITVDGDIDHETNATLTFTVNALDPSGGETGARTVNITVDDVNDPPVGATEAAANRTVPENHDLETDATADPATTATVLGTYEVTADTDPDDTDGISAITLSLGGVDGSLFSLTDTAAKGGTLDNNIYELGFKESPNYESPADADGNNKYHVTVITTDNEGASHERALVIEVTNVDEPGKVTMSTTQPAVGQPITATLTDPDMKVTGVSWQWGRSDTASNFIPIRGATSATYTPVMSVDDDPITSESELVEGDEGMYLEVTVIYSDNASARDAVNGTPDDTSDDPTDVTTTDNDESKGERLIAQPSANAVREAPDVNQMPVFESGITREVAEDAKAGDKVGGPVTANDPDGDSLTYSISGGADMGAFEITSGGQITVKEGTKLDFEGSQTTYVIEVTADDPFGMSDSTTVTITVTDANEPPEVMLLPGGTTQPDDDTVGGRANVSVPEGTTAVSTYTAPDTISSPTWSLSGVDRNSFSISSGGALSFRSAPDYESPGSADGDNVYMVTVMASGGGMTADLDVTVTVTDVTEGTPGTFNPLQYDADNNGSIEKSEMISAVNDYLFNDRITKAQMIQVINLYLFGS